MCRKLVEPSLQFAAVRQELFHIKELAGRLRENRDLHCLHALLLKEVERLVELEAQSEESVHADFQVDLRSVRVLQFLRRRQVPLVLLGVPAGGSQTAKFELSVEGKMILRQTRFYKLFSQDVLLTVLHPRAVRPTFSPSVGLASHPIRWATPSEVRPTDGIPDQRMPETGSSEDCGVKLFSREQEMDGSRSGRRG